MKIYVGNLSFNTSEQQLRELFEAHGAVSSATLVMDRDTGRPRGFGFVEMNDDAQAKAAMGDGDNKRADFLLVRAKADAELALAIAREVAAKAEAQKAVEQATAMHSSVMTTPGGQP